MKKILLFIIVTSFFIFGSIETKATSLFLNENEKIVDVELGAFFSLAVTNEGRVFTWGANESGQLGKGDTVNTSTPVEITNRINQLLRSDETVVKYRLGYAHVVALTSQGRIISWGGIGSSGSNTRNTPGILSIPFLASEEVISDIFINGASSVALTTQNRVIAWGSGDTGLLSRPFLSKTGSPSYYAISPTDITPVFNFSGDEHIINVGIGFVHAIYYSSENKAYSMGSNQSGQLAIEEFGSWFGSPIDISSQFNFGQDEVITSMNFGHEYSMMLSSNNKLYTFGSSREGEIGRNFTSVPISQSKPANITNSFLLNNESISRAEAGFRIGSVLTSNNQLWMWGSNTFGEILGRPIGQKVELPVNVTQNIGLLLDETIIDIALGGGTAYSGAIQGQHIAILTSLGRLLMAGNNQFGQLGNGNNTSSSTANSVSGISVTIDFEITFDSNGGSNISSIREVEGVSISEPQAPTRTGYTFDGWHLSEELNNGSGTKQVFPFNMTSEDKTLYAKWTLNTYDLTFVLDEGVSATALPTSYTVLSATYTLPVVEKTGHTFNGWFDNQELTGSPVTQIITGTIGDKSFYAKFNINSYTITFNTNGGSNVSAITQNYNTTVTAPEDPTRDNYLFLGWFTDIDLQNAYIFSIVPAVDQTLYAKWIENTTILFDSNGGSLVAQIDQTPGRDFTAPEAPTRTGYTFNGWFSDDLLTSAYTFDKIPEGNITLYAKWTINAYVISFDTKGGSSVPSITQNFNTDVIAPSVPTLTGYTFMGWDKELPSAMPANNLSFSAQWSINSYTITFNSNGGDTVQPITLEFDALITGISTPTREGYVFNGYSQVIPARMPAENLTITLYWRKVEIASSVDVNIEALGLFEAIDPLLTTNKNIEVTLILESKTSEEILESDQQMITSVAKRNERVQFLDIRVILKEQGLDDVEISRLTQHVSITITLDAGIQGNRNYRIVRVHEGVLDILETVYDEENQTLTFETDRFSNYAIMYQVDEDSSIIGILIIALILLLGLLAWYYRFFILLLFKRKKDDDENKHKEVKKGSRA